jgi:hypothetical protein
VRPEFLLAQQVRKFLFFKFYSHFEKIIIMIFDLQNISEAICNLISELTNMGIALHNIRGIEFLSQSIIISITLLFDKWSKAWDSLIKNLIINKDGDKLQK